jgi:hypothetical protein
VQPSRSAVAVARRTIFDCRLFSAECILWMREILDNQMEK